MNGIIPPHIRGVDIKTSRLYTHCNQKAYASVSKNNLITKKKQLFSDLRTSTKPPQFKYFNNIISWRLVFLVALPLPPVAQSHLSSRVVLFSLLSIVQILLIFTLCKGNPRRLSFSYSPFPRNISLLPRSLPFLETFSLLNIFEQLLTFLCFLIYHP